VKGGYLLKLGSVRKKFKLRYMVIAGDKLWCSSPSHCPYILECVSICNPLVVVGLCVVSYGRVCHLGV
jgi:hypothetical protein